jgi:hypothetical protein
MTIELQPEYPHRTRKRERFPLAGSCSERAPAARQFRERTAKVPVRRAARALGVLVPRRRVAAGRSSRCRRGARLPGAGADRPRRRLRLARVRAQREALRRSPDHRRRGHARRPLARDAARRDAAGLLQPLPPAHRCARAHAAARKGSQPPADPALDQALLEELNDGSSASPVARDTALPSAIRTAAARLARRSCRPLLRRSAASLRARDARRNAGLATSPSARGAHARHRRRACASSATRAAAGRPRRRPQPQLARRLRGGTAPATTSACCSRLPRWWSASRKTAPRLRARSSSPSASAST